MIAAATQMRQQNIIQRHIYTNSSKNIEKSLEESNSQKRKTSQSKMKSHRQNLK